MLGKIKARLKFLYSQANKIDKFMTILLSLVGAFMVSFSYTEYPPNEIKELMNAMYSNESLSFAGGIEKITHIPLDGIFYSNVRSDGGSVFPATYFFVKGNEMSFVAKVGYGVDNRIIYSVEEKPFVYAQVGKMPDSSLRRINMNYFFSHLIYMLLLLLATVVFLYPWRIKYCALTRKKGITKCVCLSPLVYAVLLALATTIMTAQVIMVSVFFLMP